MKKKTLRKLKKNYPLINNETMEKNVFHFREMRLNDYKVCSAKLVSDYEISRFLSCDAGFSNDLFDDQSTTTFVRTTLY